MNGLSWAIYIAETVGKVGPTAAVIAGVGAFFGIAAYAISPMTNDTWSWQTDEEKKEARERPKAIRNGVVRIVMPIVLIALFVAMVTPSRQSVYMIVASQAGEQVLQLQEVQELGGEAGALATDTITLLRQMVSDQLKESKE